MTAEGGDWTLDRTPDGQLVFVDAMGRRFEGIDVLRAFPLSAPDGPVAIVAAGGGELAWIESPALLAPPLRRVLDEELSQREFLPVIDRIEAVADGEPAEWKVVTDRGRHRFKVAHPDDVARAADGSAVVTDTYGMRYRIPKIADLDSHSRRLLDGLV
jgi:hypothetical protein